MNQELAIPNGPVPKGFSVLRPRLKFGDIELSVQASSGHNCDPKVDGLPLSEYKRVECALIRDGEFIDPGSVGLVGYWTGGVGSLDQDELERLISDLRDRVLEKQCSI